MTDRISTYGVRIVKFSGERFGILLPTGEWYSDPNDSSISYEMVQIIGDEVFYKVMGYSQMLKVEFMPTGSINPVVSVTKQYVE